MALYQDGILISGANTLPQMTLAEYNALPSDQRPTYWERTDGDYDDVLAEKSDIGNIESGTTASRAYSVGELVYYNDSLYDVITPIANGATFTIGTNIKATNISDKLKDSLILSADVSIAKQVTENTPANYSTIYGAPPGYSIIGAFITYKNSLYDVVNLIVDPDNKTITVYGYPFTSFTSIVHYRVLYKKKQ